MGTSSIDKNNQTVDVSAVGEDSNSSIDFIDEYNPDGLKLPTIEETKTLRKVIGGINWKCYLVCVVELAERGSYYSVTGVINNFIQRPLPEGSVTGAPVSNSLNESAGALDKGLQVATALHLLLNFLVYVVPLYGGYIGDAKLGRFKAIWIGIGAGLISHILFVIAAIPSVITGGNALAPTILAVLTLALGTGFIKPNLLPLLLDQYPYQTDLVKTLPSGERVIIDRELTLQSITLIFYWTTNVGAFFQLGASYAERRIGFWLAFFFPIIMYLTLPLMLWPVRNKLRKSEPAGSVLTYTLKILFVVIGGLLARKTSWKHAWDFATPSEMRSRGKVATWNNQWVEDVKKTFNACKIFIYFPMFSINDGGIGTIITSLAGSMTTEGVPNDLFFNFNPLTIIVEMPLLNYIILPFFRKHHINFSPVYRITLGFILAATSQVAGAVIQYQVYETSPCGYYATNCDAGVSPLTAWKVSSLYILGAAGGGLAVTSAYEISYTRSPPQMKGLVMALLLLSFAIAAAISQAVTPALRDPYLIWPFAGCAIAGFVLAGMFFIQFRNLNSVKENKEEDVE